MSPANHRAWGRRRGVSLSKKVTFVCVLAVLTLAAEPLVCPASGTASRGRQKIAVIFDTDICDDIDDTWALAMLLQSPEFDVKLITTEVGNTESKARTIAKLLQTVGRTDIPIGIGVQQHKGGHRQDAWAKDYNLSSYPGKIHTDGVQAIIDTVMSSRRRIKIIAVGPLPNIAAALEREPKIAQKAEFVGMHGSIYKGYGGSAKPSPEYNVKAFVKEAQKVFAAPWDMTITPLDTCGVIVLKGDKYQKVFKHDSPLTRALIENYRAWYTQPIVAENKDLSAEEIEKRVNEKVNSSSSVLFDTVGIYLGMSTELVKMEKLKIKVTDDGFTRIDEAGKLINCATEWKDLDAFEDLLVRRLVK
ncbi:MAG: nucleoside hydrolase [Sedimentisphaerales bacterium]|nr:nucleoside hydrolase [Sedimentisphaerales bacterium]